MTSKEEINFVKCVAYECVKALLECEDFPETEDRLDMIRRRVNATEETIAQIKENENNEQHEDICR